jgi:hypothetical protein
MNSGDRAVHIIGFVIIQCIMQTLVLRDYIIYDKVFGEELSTSDLLFRSILALIIGTIVALIVSRKVKNDD